MKRWMMMTIAAIAVFALFGCGSGTEEQPADSSTPPAEGGATTGDMAGEPSTTTDTSGAGNPCANTGTTEGGTTKGGTTGGGATGGGTTEGSADTGTSHTGAGSTDAGSGGGH